MESYHTCDMILGWCLVETQLWPLVWSDYDILSISLYRSLLFVQSSLES